MATVQFLQQLKEREDYFKWPHVENVASSSAEFVFRWDFDVCPVSSDGRLWQIDRVEGTVASCNTIKGNKMHACKKKKKSFDNSVLLNVFSSF